MTKIISKKLSKYNLVQGLVLGNFGRLRFRDNNDGKQIIKNRKKYFAVLGIDLKQVVLQEQVHGDKISVVSSKDRGSGVFDPRTYIKNNDGLIAKDKNVYLGCFTADCLPIMFYDPERKICGIAHSGWRGTIKDIAGRMIRKFIKLDAKAKDIIVYVGPAIGSCCYEISQAKDERIKMFREIGKKLGGKIFLKKDGKKLYLDLKEAVKQELLAAGINKNNIEISKICTCCNKGFPSYYRDRKVNVDLLSVIGML